MNRARPLLARSLARRFIRSFSVKRSLSVNDYEISATVGPYMNQFNQVTTSTERRYFALKAMCDINQTHPGLMHLGVDFFTSVRDKEQALKCAGNLEMALEELNDQDKVIAQKVIEDNKKHWEHEVPSIVASIAKRRSKLKDDKFELRWKPNVGMIDYTFESNKENIISKLANEWSDLKLEMKNEELVDDITNLLFGIKTGDVERVYSLSNGVTATVLLNVQPEFWKEYMNTNDMSQLQEGYVTDPEIINEIVYSQSHALCELYENVSQQKFALSKELINEGHKLNMQSWPFTLVGPSHTRTVLYVRPGLYKIYPNSPTTPNNVIFEYCPPQHVESEMNNLVEMFNDQFENYDIINLAAWLHHAYILIHPFQDGNGRVARLLVSLLFMCNKLPPLIVDTADKQVYIAALKIANTTKDIRPLAAFLEYCLQSTIGDTKAIMKAKKNKMNKALNERAEEKLKLRAKFTELYQIEVPEKEE